MHITVSKAAEPNNQNRISNRIINRFGSTYNYHLSIYLQEFKHLHLRTRVRYVSVQTQMHTKGIHVFSRTAEPE